MCHLPLFYWLYCYFRLCDRYLLTFALEGYVSPCLDSYTVIADGLEFLLILVVTFVKLCYQEFIPITTPSYQSRPYSHQYLFGRYTIPRDDNTQHRSTQTQAFGWYRWNTIGTSDSVTPETLSNMLPISEFHATNLMTRLSASGCLPKIGNSFPTRSTSISSLSNYSINNSEFG